MLRLVWLLSLVLVTSCNTTGVKKSNLASTQSLNIKEIDTLRKSANLDDVYLVCADNFEARYEGYKRINCELRIPYSFYGQHVDYSLTLLVQYPDYEIRDSEIGFVDSSKKFVPFATFDKNSWFDLLDDENANSEGSAYKLMFLTDNLKVNLRGPEVSLPENLKYLLKKSTVYTLLID